MAGQCRRGIRHGGTLPRPTFRPAVHAPHAFLGFCQLQQHEREPPTGLQRRMVSRATDRRTALEQELRSELHGEREGREVQTQRKRILHALRHGRALADHRRELPARRRHLLQGGTRTVLLPDVVQHFAHVPVHLGQGVPELATVVQLGQMGRPQHLPFRYVQHRPRTVRLRQPAGQPGLARSRRPHAPHRHQPLQDRPEQQGQQDERRLQRILRHQDRTRQ